MVPRAVALKIGVVGASALVSGLVTDASISAVNGPIVIDGVRGDLQVNTVNGEITVRGHAGRLATKSVSGDVTASGEISPFTAEVVSGDVLADLAGRPETVKVSTVSGAVTLRLDGDLPATYTVNSAGGRVQVDDAPISGLRGRYTAQCGAPGERRSDIRINTVSGAVSVLHAVRA
jgi:DUF4097 and DUF4098 domain-containing protein YvlB